MSSRQERREREAYLNEQVARQQRGEPVDVEWVRAELARVRQEQKDKLMSTERTMRWMVMGMAGLFCVLWIAGNVVANHGPRLLVPIVMIATLTVWSLYRRNR
jgi:Flp pilus assembly protein TadB